MLKPQSYSHPLLANELQTAEILYWSASASQYNRLATTDLSKVQQLLAVAHKSLQQVTEKYQLLEDKRRFSFWQKLKAQFSGA